jgi:DNA-binding Lrp family transcriptional regulator
MNTKKEEFNLDEIILEIVREMQPISSEEVWMEIGENLDLESNLSQEEVNQILEKMEKEKILESIKLKSEEEKYTVVEK